jgi:hypothetical protein
VRFDHVTGDRFRHGTKLTRWHPPCCLDRVRPGDGICDVTWSDEVFYETLHRGLIETFDHAERAGGEPDHPDTQDTDACHDPDRERQRPETGLRQYQQAPAVTTIRDDTAKHAEYHQWTELQRVGHAQSQSRMTEFEDQPVLDRDLHPGAYVRNDLRREVQLEIAVAQRGQSSPPGTLDARRTDVCCCLFSTMALLMSCRTPVMWQRGQPPIDSRAICARRLPT